MESIQIWILGGCLGLALVILAFLAKDWFQNLTKEVKSMVAVLTEIKVLLASQAKDIEFIYSEIGKLNDRLNIHGERIHDLEKRNAND